MSSSSTAKPQAHRRVWNKSNFSNTHITLKIVAIKNLPSGSFFSKGKYFMRIALGGNDPVSTKSNSTATFSEEFSADIDFDDQIIFKLFDEKKVERSDGSVEPVGKLAIPMRKIPLGEQEKDFKMKGSHGVEMTLRTTLVKNEIQPGRVYRKMFGYPVWMSDKYGVNFVDPDLETLEVGLTTLVRYAIKWLRGQRMIALSGKAFKFNLIDLSLSYHNRAMALAVVYTWIETTEALPPPPTSSSSSADTEAEKEDTDDEDEEEEDKGPKVMKAKMFSMPFKTLPKKTIQSFKPLPEEKYTKEFKAMIDGFDQIYRMAEIWMEENSHHYAEIYKVQVFSSDVSHHAVVWYN